MSTNRKEIKEYLLSIIDFDGYELEKQPATDNEKVLAAFQIAKAEVGHIRNRQEMIEYWFSGLCSVVSLPYLCADIIPLAVKWGSLPADYTDKQADKICQNWFHYLAAQFCQMVNKASR
jgi:hypothetical protein